MSFNKCKETDLGYIPSEWNIETVESLCDKKIIQKPMDGNHGGIHPTQKDFIEYGIPFIMASDLKDSRIDFKTCKFISQKTAQGLKKGFAIQGDVLLTHKATIGRVAIVPKLKTPYIVLTPQVTYYRVNDLNQLDNRYLMYYFKWDKFNNLFNSWAQSGSTRAYLGITAQKKLPILLPNIHEQKAIADILSSLDDKIELNNQMNETLEEMAQALFKRWFVDFEFPNEKGQPYKSSGGEMIESELGMIPKGWDVKYLSEIVDNFDSKRIPLSKREREKREKIYPYYGAASIADYVDDFIFDGCYVLMGEDGTVIDNNGYPILQYVWGKFWVNNHAHVLQGKSYYSNEFVYLKLKSTNVQSLVTGAVQPKINQKNMNSIKVAVAPKEIHVEFNKIIESIYSQLKLNIDQNEVLKQLRDSLLPKLMSGEIRVSDLEG